MAKTAPTNTDMEGFEGTQDWEEIDTEYGEKVTFTPGDVFIGEFQTLRPVLMDDGKDATAAEFIVKGDKFYTWAPARLLGALTRAIEDGKLSPGQTVRIECTGEEPNRRPGYSPSKTFKLSIRPNA